MSVVLPCTPWRPLVYKELHRISMELDFPMWLKTMERINLIRSKVSKNMTDMCVATGAQLPLMWYLHIDEFPLLWSLNPDTLRVRVSAIVYGMY